MEHGKDVGRRASLEAVGVLCRDMAGVPQATCSVLRGTAWTQSSPVTRAPPPPLAVVFLLSSQALRWALPWPIHPFGSRHVGGSRDSGRSFTKGQVTTPQ